MEDENLQSEEEIAGSDEWMNEHGQPDFEYLMALANEESEEALEKLRDIADDLDAEYDPHATAHEIVDAIRLAAENNGDVHPEMLP